MIHVEHTTNMEWLRYVATEFFVDCNGCLRLRVESLRDGSSLGVGVVAVQGVRVELREIGQRRGQAYTAKLLEQRGLLCIPTTFVLAAEISGNRA